MWGGLQGVSKSNESLLKEIPVKCRFAQAKRVLTEGSMSRY